MATNFDATRLAVQTAFPTNDLLFDDKEMPSIHVFIPKFRLCDVLSTQSTETHPAFIVNGKEDLNRLLEEELVDYHFQPIVDMRVGEVVAYEALMRSRMESIPTPDRVLELARSQSKLYRVSTSRSSARSTRSRAIPTRTMPRCS